MKHFVFCCDLSCGARRKTRGKGIHFFCRYVFLHASQKTYKEILAAVEAEEHRWK
jgi:hypothetical protein